MELVILGKRAHSVNLSIEGRKVPRVSKLKSLGMWIQANRRNRERMDRLQTSVHKICRMLRRFCNCRKGIKEGNMLRLLRAFVISRIAYAVPYLNLKVSEKRKLETHIRRGIKTALGLPDKTSMERILNLGVSNTLKEISEARLTSQYVRLRGSKSGRAVLRKVGYQNATTCGQLKAIPRELEERLRIPPAPTEHAPRARRRAAQGTLRNRVGVVYTDVARAPGAQHYVFSVVHPEETTIACCSSRAGSVVEAERIAIALALTNHRTRIVVADSKLAIWAYKGYVGTIENRFS